jgi:hypothetical protein
MVEQGSWGSQRNIAHMLLDEIVKVDYHSIYIDGTLLE